MRKPQPRRVKIVRYVDSEGRRVPKGTPGARKVESLSDTYYLTVTVGGERQTHSLHTADLGVAHVRARRLRKRLKHGGDPGMEEHARRPLKQHLADWLADVKAGGAGQDYLDQLRRHVHKLAALAGWKRLEDIEPSSCLRALSALTYQRGGKPVRCSARTRNHYLTQLRTFVLWCCGPGRRLRYDPLAGMRKGKVEHDLRHQRRCPEDTEVEQLFAWLERPEADLPGCIRYRYQTGKVRSVRVAMTGRQRALGYQVAMGAGLRSQELRSLTRDSFDLDAGTVTVSSAYDKRRRQATLPLPPWLCASLRAYFDAGNGTWENFPEEHAGRVLRHDLERAGVAYSLPGPDGKPLFFDFHSLRYWYCTKVAGDPANNLKTIQELCRHSTPSLTLSIYAKVRGQEVRSAADRIPRPGA